MKVGDLVKHTSLVGIRIGIVTDLDPEANGVLCFMRGQSLWFTSHQLEILSAT
jgi:hypothetical protein